MADCLVPRVEEGRVGTLFAGVFGVVDSLAVESETRSGHDAPASEFCCFVVTCAVDTL